MTRAFGLAGALLFAAACGGNKTSPGPCDQDPPAPECIIECDPTPGAANTCPSGFHCAPDGFCDAQCTQGGSECGDGYICTNDGYCLQVDGDANFGPDADCPDVQFTAERVTPTIQLLLDESGSMDDNFQGGTRKYDAMRNALVGAMGVVNDYQAAVYFGATLYTQSSACPDLRPGAGGTGRALNNATAIANLINAHDPGTDGGGTPTGPALEATYQEMLANPPPTGSPPIIILATDGQPFTCPDNEDNAAGQAQSLAAATAAFAAGIPVYVLGLAPSGDTGLNNHLQQVANVGQGQDPVTGTATYYPASDPGALADAFDTIIGGVVSCSLMLDGDISEQQAAAGTVLLNGMPLMYGTDWTLSGSNVIVLQGAACTTLQGSTDPTVVGNFPCGNIIE
jgi:hypothetical protein